MRATIEVTVTHKIRVPIACQSDAEKIRKDFEARIDQGYPEIVIEENGIEVTHYPEKKISSSIPFVDMNW